MNNVLIDITRLLHRFMQGRMPTGVDRVSLAYIDHYGHRALAMVRWGGRGFLLSPHASEQLFRRLLCPTERFERSLLSTVLSGLAGGLVQQQVAGRFLFNTGHSGLEHPRYAQMLRRLKVRPLFLVHDLIPLTHPEYCRPQERERHVRRLDNVLALAAGIVTNSHATKDALESYALRSKMTLAPSVAALLAPGMPLTSPGPRPITAPYFVMLSTIEPRKNHWLILQIWRRLVERLGDAAPVLVVIGQRGWECENVVDLLDRCEPLRGNVIERSTCTDDELVTYLHHAQALLFPSFAEGYGMPVVEALALGVPVIASNLPVFREIADGIPEYIDPLDGRRWAEIIEDYAQPESASRAAQMERMTNFSAPGWSDHFRKVDALMETLGASRL